MPDEFDRASDIELAHREEAVRVALQQDVPQRHAMFDGQHCVECEVALPAVRLQMQRVRCVTCQEEMDQRKARR